jgi:membrane dipeptidase
VGLHTTFAALLHVQPRPDGPVPQRVPWVDGLENPTENFHNIAAWLVQEGFTDEEIRKVLGGNVLRVLEEIWV